MNNYKIKEGDQVIVCFLTVNGGHSMQGEVKHMPADTGDSWIIVSDGVTYYIQRFDYIQKL